MGKNEILLLTAAVSGRLLLFLLVYLAILFSIPMPRVPILKLDELTNYCLDLKLVEIHQV